MGEFLDPWAYLARLGVSARRARDPFFVEGDSVCAMRAVTYLTQEDDEAFLHRDHELFPCSEVNCDRTFTQLHDFEAHVAAAHAHQCGHPGCGTTLPSAHLLDLHASEAHDSFFAVVSERKPSFQCFLEKCERKFWNPDERKTHCLDAHDFSRDFKYIDGWPNKEAIQARKESVSSSGSGQKPGRLSLSRLSVCSVTSSIFSNPHREEDKEEKMEEDEEPVVLRRRESQERREWRRSPLRTSVPADST